MFSWLTRVRLSYEFNEYFEDRERGLTRIMLYSLADESSDNILLDVIGDTSLLYLQSEVLYYLHINWPLNGVLRIPTAAVPVQFARSILEMQQMEAMGLCCMGWQLRCVWHLVRGGTKRRNGGRRRCSALDPCDAIQMVQRPKYDTEARYEQNDVQDVMSWTSFCRGSDPIDWLQCDGRPP